MIDRNRNFTPFAYKTYDKGALLQRSVFMTHLCSVLLFVISANLDNIVIGIAYGISKIKMQIFSNLLIAFFTTIGTLVSMYAGKLLISVLPVSLAGKIGAGIMMLLGLFFLAQSILHFLHQNQTVHSVALKDADEMIDYAAQSDKDVSGFIDIKEAFAVGLGLTLNNLGTGLIAGVSGIPIIPVALLNFVSSFAFLSIGFLLGNRFLGKLLGKFAPFLSGVLLIVLGLVEWFF